MLWRAAPASLTGNIYSCCRTTRTISILRGPWQASTADRGHVRNEFREVVSGLESQARVRSPSFWSGRSRAQFLFSIMVSGFDNVHIRANVPRLEQAIKYGQSAGDRIYTSFSTAHLIVTRLYIGDHRKYLYIDYFKISLLLTLDSERARHRCRRGPFRHHVVDAKRRCVNSGSSHTELHSRYWRIHGSH